MRNRFSQIIATLMISTLLTVASVAGADEQNTQTDVTANAEQTQGSGAALFPEWSASLKALFEQLFSDTR